MKWGILWRFPSFFEKKLLKNLQEPKNSRTFAPAFEEITPRF